MDIVVKGRRSEVSERYRAHVREKLSRLARLDGKAFRIDVEVCHESNPRQAGACERIELTVYSRGPVIRAEAAAGDVYAALDLASAKLEERLRRAADRRHTRQHGHLHGNGSGHATVKGAEPHSDLGSDLPSPEPTVASGNGASMTQPPVEATIPAPAPTPQDEQPDAEDLGDVLVADGPLVVRQKVHSAPPMTLDEALHHMELVGHDFFLYCDSATRLPSVVYRRRGYTYGVLRLQTQAMEAAPRTGAVGNGVAGNAAGSNGRASTGAVGNGVVGNGVVGTGVVGNGVVGTGMTGSGGAAAATA